MVRPRGRQEVTKSIEGFLYPSTYEIPPKATAEQILSMMVDEFLRVTKGLDFVNRAKAERKISPYEALITASIAQAEAVDPKDFAKVSRVIYNRVYAGKIGCRCLGIDSGINYSFRLQGIPRRTPTTCWPARSTT